MKRRPWPIVILAWLHIFAPFFTILSSAWLMGQTPSAYLKIILATSTPSEIFTIFTLLPLAGISIYLMRRWSYFAFLAFMGANFLNLVREIRNFPQYVHLPIFVAFNCVNLVVVGYFFFRKVRVAYFDQTQHWWETSPRYLINVPAQIEGSYKNRHCIVEDISEGGVFVRGLKRLDEREVILHLNAFDQDVHISCEVVWKRKAPEAGFGLRFLNAERSSPQIKKIIDQVKLTNPKGRNPAPDAWADFTRWAKSLFTTGKGLLPDVKVSEKKPDSDSNSGKAA